MSNKFRKIIFFCLEGYLFLSLLQLPNVLVQNEHDLGSQAAYEYWLLNSFQYGIDFLQNVGPYGFLNYPLIYSGFFFYAKIFINLFLVISLLYLIPKFNLKIFLVFVLSFSLFNKQDVFIYILMHVAFMHILHPSSKLKQLLSLFVTALLCLSKSTCLFVALWGVIVLILKSHIYKEKFFAKVLLFILFLASLWLLAGQSLIGFVYYLNGAIKFSNGYNEAMAVQEPLYVTFSAVCIFLYYLYILSKRLAYTNSRNKIAFILDSLFYVFLLFVIWKHGMVRADAGHNAIFFAYAIFAISSQKMIIDGEIIGEVLQGPRFNVVFPVALLLSSFFLFKASNIALDKYIYYAFSVARQNFYFLINFQETKNSLDQQLIIFKSNLSLSKFKEIKRTDKVGYLGVKPAIMLYNEFNYLTNPSTISFASWNQSTMLADSVFFAYKLDFLIVELETIDHRYLPLDSSLSKIEVLKGFSFVASDGPYLLLKRKESKTALTFLPYGTELPYTVGSWKTIPNTSGFTWMKIDLKSNLFESVLSIPYKPMSYYIEFNYENNEFKSYRFIPALGEQGFLLTPEILNNNDLANYLEHSSVRKERPKEFRIICTGLRFFCKEKGSVQFSNVVGL